MRVVGLVVSLVVVLGMLGSTVAMASAASQAAQSVQGLLDPAALTVRPADLDQPGWAHEGAFVQDLPDQARDHAAYLGSGTTAEEIASSLTAAGWERQYVSVLSRASPRDPDSPSQRIRSYLTRYGSSEGAAVGFAYLEDERVVASAADVATTRTHGTESELTQERGTAADGRPFRSLDLTFRIGNLVAGVALTDYASTDRADQDQELVERLATLMEGRFGAAESDASGLGHAVLRLDGRTRQLVTFDDAYYRIAGDDVPLAGESARDASLRTSSYAEATEVYQLWQGIDTGREAGALFGITLLRFPDEAAADEWVSGLESVLAENPFYGDLRFAAGAAELDVGDEALALTYVANGGGGDAPRAALLAVRVGVDVARVHLVPQGALPSIPIEPVVELARSQVACLQDQIGAACAGGRAEIPPTLTNLVDEAGAPEASPVAGS